MKKLYRTTSIIGFSLMSIPLILTLQYIIQPSQSLYLAFALVSFLLASIFLLLNLIDSIKLSNFKKKGHCLSLKIISIIPIKILHVRGFYTFRIISEYKDSDGVNHRIHTAMYSVLNSCPQSKLESFYIDNLSANIYIKNSKYGIEVIYN